MHWVLTDLNLPGDTDGLQLVSKLRAEAQAQEDGASGKTSASAPPRWPVVTVVSGDASEDLRNRCVEVSYSLSLSCVFLWLSPLEKRVYLFWW